MNAAADTREGTTVITSDHAAAAEKLQDELIRRMTPARRLEIARGLYETAWRIKEAALRQQFPDWPEEQLQARLRHIFVTGHAGA